MQLISTLAFCAPLLVDKDDLVFDGEAGQLGLATLPCNLIDHLTKAELRCLRLAINRLSEKGEWELAELKAELEELIFLDAPITIIGFSSDEIDQIVLDDETSLIEKGPLELDAASVPVARPGDVFQLGPHRLTCNDAIDPTTYRALFGGASDVKARLNFTDEP